MKYKLLRKRMLNISGQGTQVLVRKIYKGGEHEQPKR